MTFHQTKPIVLTLAGSDPCGGAGLQADLRVTAALGCYGVSVVTALTAQNTMGVARVWPLAPEQIEEQARTLLSDIQPQAVKVGMLGSGPAAQAVAAVLKQYRMPNIVADTILHSTSGADLLGCSKTDPLIEVMSMARVITPNLPEAAALLSAPPTAANDIARRLSALAHGASVYLKGGHANGQLLTDVFYNAEDDHFIYLEHPRIDTPNTHGTGCTLSSSLAANLAKGLSLEEAVKASKAYVTEAIAYGIELGAGCGPTHHFVDLYRKAGILEK